MVTARRMAIATIMGIRTLMADVFRVFFEGVIPALSGDPLICREAELSPSCGKRIGEWVPARRPG
jgi:hypothetical protein